MFYYIANSPLTYMIAIIVVFAIGFRVDSSFDSYFRRMVMFIDWRKREKLNGKYIYVDLIVISLFVLLVISCNTKIIK